MTQKNVYNMSINDKVGLNEQNDPNLVLPKKKYIYTYTYTNIHKQKGPYQNVKYGHTVY